MLDAIHTQHTKIINPRPQVLPLAHPSLFNDLCTRGNLEPSMQNHVHQFRVYYEKGQGRLRAIMHTKLCAYYTRTLVLLVSASTTEKDSDTTHL